MSSDTPFFDANNFLQEAAGWLSDILLPTGHADREDDDDSACLEAAVDLIDRATNVLTEWGCEYVDVGSEVVDDFCQPIVETRIVDPDAVNASNAILALTKAIRFYNDDIKLVLAPSLIDEIRNFIGAHYNARLEAEKAHRKEIQDACSY